MDLAAITLIVSLFGSVGAVVLGVVNARGAARRSSAISHLETSKLDLSVAQLGHEVFQDLLLQLRAEVKDCHEERDQFRAMLVAQGLIPK